MQNRRDYDVIICGGGLAGQTLARQLQLEIEGLNVLLLEKDLLPRPLSLGKVGESTVEIASYYFETMLELQEYFRNEHLLKCGLRFFFKENQERIENYPEIGLTKYPRFNSYQMDRVKFENDLHYMNELAGTTIISGVHVKNLEVNEADTQHQVTYEDAEGILHQARARWLVDASGRRRLIQKKLKLRKESNSSCSAVWFRVKGLLDVSDFVSTGQTDWHKRVPQRLRHFATVHFMGPSYWLWLIPLPTGKTSVGIVFDEKAHAFSRLNKVHKAFAWLEEQDKALHDQIINFELLDFAAIRNYSYSSKQVFSADRWACTGEAAVFPDPFYSPGSNLIAYGNSIISKLIRDDKQGITAPAAKYDYYNQYIISQNDLFIYNIQSSYQYFGDAQVMSLSYLWDLIASWAIATPQIVNQIFLDDDKINAIKDTVTRFTAIGIRMRQLFVAWSKQNQKSFYFDHINYLEIPFIREIYLRCSEPNKTTPQLIEDFSEVMDLIEEYVHVAFYMILKDCRPYLLDRLPKPYWINVLAVSLNSEDWERNKLYEPTTPARDLTNMFEQFSQVYKHQKEDVVASIG